jgi:hypothetical protein
MYTSMYTMYTSMFTSCLHTSLRLFGISAASLSFINSVVKSEDIPKAISSVRSDYCYSICYYFEIQEFTLSVILKVTNRNFQALITLFNTRI